MKKESIYRDKNVFLDRFSYRLGWPQNPSVAKDDDLEVLLVLRPPSDYRYALLPPVCEVLGTEHRVLCRLDKLPTN